jgi:hypothetical protein
MKGQKMEILNLLDATSEQNPLTPLQALRLAGTMKLATRIGELRAMGYPIRQRSVDVNTRHGKKRVCGYWIEEEMNV